MHLTLSLPLLFKSFNLNDGAKQLIQYDLGHLQTSKTTRHVAKELYFGFGFSFFRQQYEGGF